MAGDNKLQACPCGSNKIYDDCCGAFISGNKSPTTAEELMRSRFTAYKQNNMHYIAATMKSPAADNFDPEVASNEATKITWTKLTIVNASQKDNRGFVEFIAHYAADNRTHFLHEISEFIFQENKWYYIKGKSPKHAPAVKEKVGRND